MAQEFKCNLCAGFAMLQFPIKANWKFIYLLVKPLSLVVFCGEAKQEIPEGKRRMATLTETLWLQTSAGYEGGG